MISDSRGLFAETYKMQRYFFSLQNFAKRAACTARNWSKRKLDSLSLDAHFLLGLEKGRR
jgi:hypothetical protein